MFKKLLSKKSFFKILTGLGLGLGATIFMQVLTDNLAPDFWENLERSTYDFRYEFKFRDISEIQSVGQGATLVDNTKSDPDEYVIILNIDDKSFDKMGSYWKWSRAWMGTAISYLKEGNAAATAFDIMYDNADFGESKSKVMASKLVKYGIGTEKKLRPILKKEMDEETPMVRDIKNANNVITAFILEDTIIYEHRSLFENFLGEKRAQQIGIGSAAKFPEPVMTGLKEAKPGLVSQLLAGIFPELAHASRRIGYVNVRPDYGEIHRTIPLFWIFSGRVYTGIALQTALMLMDKNLGDIEIELGKSVNMGKPFHITKNQDGSLIPSYPSMFSQQILDFFDNKDKIAGLDSNASITVSNSLRIVRDEEGDVFIEFSNADGEPYEIPFQLAYEIYQVGFDQVKEFPVDQLTGVSDQLALAKKADGLYEMQAVIDGDMETLNLIKPAILQGICQMDLKAIKKIQPENSILLNDDLTISRIQGIYKSEYSMFNNEVIRELLDKDVKDFDNLKAGESVSFGNEIVIPIDDQGRMIINYFGNSNYYRKISFSDVYYKRNQKEFFRGKTIMLGSTAKALFDQVSSPFEEVYPGLLIHVNVLNSIIKNEFMVRQNATKALIIMIICAMVLGLANFIIKPLLGFVALVFAILFYGAYAFTFFSEKSVWVPFVLPIASFFATFLAVTVYRYITEEKDKKFLHNTFKQYLSPELIDQMYENREMPQLGGSEEILTAYFTDIQGFSTFSEKLGSPTKLVALLNEYLTAMTDILLESRGTLDKYEGDAIIAFFGAPFHLPDHADRACLAALAMQKKLGDLREKWREEGEKWPEIVKEMQMRIGVNSGPIVTGNMGSAMRMNYTMMGDSVNLAARLESGAKQYGVFSMCSDTVLNLLKTDRVIHRQLDIIRVVGKSEPVKISELICDKDHKTDEVEKMMKYFAEGREQYTAKNWDNAIESFTEAIKYEIKDGEPGVRTCPSRVFLQRCQDYKASPPPGDWDGVFVATEK